MARLHDLAVETLSTGNFIIEYAPGCLISGYSLVGLHSSVQTQNPQQCKTATKALRDAAQALQLRKWTPWIPIPCYVQ
jgi:hypothetical protein